VELLILLLSLSIIFFLSSFLFLIFGLQNILNAVAVSSFQFRILYLKETTLKILIVRL